MGAWGVGTFENDDALDWADAFDRASELQSVENTSFIEETLRVVTERGDEYLESPDACRALAAAEVVAALEHASGPKLPDRVVQWISHRHLDGSSLPQVALNAIQRIRTSSELKDLWDESGSTTEWYEVISQLEARLKS